MKYPALDVIGIDGDLLVAAVDDFAPTAVEARESLTTVFFGDAVSRDEARRAIVHEYPDAIVSARDVDDEKWAERSQQNLTPVTVGRITVSPPWAMNRNSHSHSEPLTSDPFEIVIAPSMGFGTGHHATTRLCLRALQELDVTGRRVLDVGTGSGVLAIAAGRLGAREVVGIDDDRDAIQSAIENLERNPAARGVRFEVRDLRAAPLPTSDVITANLTGALLIRSSDLLLGALAPGGLLIVSGLQGHERDEVVRACGRAMIVWEAMEDEWGAIIFRL